MRQLFYSTILILTTTLIRSVYSEGDGTDLGGGIVTRTNVEYLADLSLDIKDMTQSYGNSNVVLDIFDNGRNAQKPSGIKFKLKDLNDEMASRGLPVITPPFLFQLYGLADQSFETDQIAQHSQYGNNNVRAAISGGQNHAPTAALVLSVWMYAAHSLYRGVEMCQIMTEADSIDQLDLAGGGMDELIALWIGSGETHSGTDGFGLYGLAQRAAVLFDGGGDSSGEANANDAIKKLYLEGSSFLSVNGACTKKVKDSPKILWSVANRIVSKMYIPLIQMLIDAVMKQDATMTTLYATAVVPQASQCRTTTYVRLREHLLTGSPRFDKTESILRDIQEVHSCFGLTCEDIGTYLNIPEDFTFPDCFIASDDAALAGYQPVSDVLPIAKIDLDVAQMRILSTLGNFKYARYWFLYGRNSPVQRDSENDLHSFYSVHDFAIASSRKNADDVYVEFVGYFNDVNYGDTIITQALEGTGKWGTKTTQQRAAIIAETSSFLVLYLHLVSQINDAVNHCTNTASGGEYDLTDPWDEVAALLIGSLEGTQEGGATDGRDGQLVWGLATRRAFQFQTLNSMGYAQTNSDLINALWAGRGEIDALDCVRFSETAQEIQKLTLVPLLQSIIRYAILNEKLEAGSPREELAFGETYALAVLPIIKAVDENLANIIQENMIFWEDVKPVRDGAQTVADAVGSAAVSLGIRCSLLGSTSQANPCRNVASASSQVVPSFLFTSIAAAIVTVLAVL
eukprot:scaffold11979_cov130-Cylindrotheca_fusiformis.AAC.4